MMELPGAALAGAWAALRAPFWLEGPRLAALLRAPADSRRAAAPPRGAVSAAMRTVGLLARLPRSPWRNTCLYRSVAECLVLRRYGVPAQVRIGVRSDAEGGRGGEILAHAWVVRAGESGDRAPSSDGHVPLVLRA
jgi:hypothetical protein